MMTSTMRSANDMPQKMTSCTFAGESSVLQAVGSTDASYACVVRLLLAGSQCRTTSMLSPLLRLPETSTFR